MIRTYIVALDASTDAVRSVAGMLDEGERARAAAFRSADDARRFIIAHGALRLVLGRELKRAPRALEFTTTEHGRPELADTAAGVSLTHSGELAAIAVAPHRTVGIDLEATVLPPDARALAQTFFAPEEAAMLRGLTDDALRRAFFRCWTRKEAVLKAAGVGIDERGLRELVVTLDEEPRVVAWRPAVDEPARWQLRALVLPADYEGAVAWRGEAMDVQTSQLGAATIAAAPDA